MRHTDTQRKKSLLRAAKSLSPWHELRFRYKFLTAGLPLVSAAISLYVLFVPLGVYLALKFGIDPALPIASQSSNGIFVLILLALIAGLIVSGWLICHVAIFLAVWLAYRDRRIAERVVLGREYPPSWKTHE